MLTRSAITERVAVQNAENELSDARRDLEQVQRKAAADSEVAKRQADKAEAGHERQAGLGD